MDRSTVWDHVHGITHEVIGPLMPLVSDYCRMKLGMEPAAMMAMMTGAPPPEATKATQSGSGSGNGKTAAGTPSNGSPAAAPAPTGRPAAAQAPARPASTAPTGGPTRAPGAPPKANPMALMRKLNEAKKLLTPDELTEIGRRVTEMSNEQRDRWADELGALSVVDAVARIREYLQVGAAPTVTEPAA